VTVEMPLSVAKDVLRNMGPKNSTGSSFDFYHPLDQAVRGAK
jgi:hypothetical protein